MIYILCFIFSTFFLWLGTRKCNRQCMKNGDWKKIRFKRIYIVIGLLFPILLATFRDTTIGSDVEYYVVPYFKSACAINGFSDYVAYIGKGQTDLAYAMINYIISRFTHDISFLFFVVQTIIVGFVFAGFWHMRGKAYPWLSMLFYYLLFYNMSLSTVRQSCALAISFCAVCIAFRYSFSKSQMIKIVGLIFLAILFHSSAVFTFVVLLICLLFERKKIKLTTFVIGATVICLIFGVFFNEFMPVLLGIISLVNIKYTNTFFLLTDNVGASGYKSIIIMALIVLFFQLIINKRKVNQMKCIDNALMGFDIVYILSMLFLSKIAFTVRLLYYIQVLWPLSFGQINIIFGGKKANRIISTVILILIALTYWTYFYVIGGVHGTFPYLFR